MSGGAATAEPMVVAKQQQTVPVDTHAHPAPPPVIDDGMRPWYDACPCCLGDTFPEIRAALEAEPAAAGRDASGPGICEVEEGMAGVAAPAIERANGTGRPSDLVT